MKRKILLSFVIFGLTFLSSCSDFLQVSPKDFIYPSTYYVDESQLEMALAGVYDPLGSTNLYGMYMLYRMGLDADNGYAFTSETNGPHVFNFTANDPLIAGFWKELYVGVTRANVLLDNIDKSADIQQEVRDRVKGEALFLRGYYYFLLVQNFGGVPLVLEPVTTVSNFGKKRSSAAEVYAQILLDMEAAEKLVEDIQILGYGGRVNKSAVRGILARVCLFMAGQPLNDRSKYEDARNWAKKVMDDTEADHSLNPSYSSVFINYTQDKYDIKESIWEVEFWGNRSDGHFETGTVGAYNGILSNNAQTGTAVGGMRATASLYNLYSDGDARRSWAIAEFTYNPTGAAGAKTYFATTTPAAVLYNRFPGKYRREYELLTPKAPSATPQNFPLLRYADVLLMFAEAENELNDGPTSEAIEAINSVRRRGWSTGLKEVVVTAGGSGYSSAPTVSFVGGGGEGVSGVSVIAAGAVSRVAFYRDEILSYKMGTNFSSAPEVIFTGGGGSGAAATASIYSKADADITELQRTNYDEFRSLVQDERARELCFEGLRRNDLIRWGIFVDRMNETGFVMNNDIPGSLYAQQYRNVSSRHTLFPIPNRELILNQELVQNEGW